ncbi:FprA family A-type flavoprotein [Oscillospiraceae bacterium OttesenSCG-928-F05]|nr:FprA family A-type flavoprotein [Oscillospiraceae bacterium OttesenSCG-928-F05]
MKSVKIRENIYWVGGIDYDVRVFHGYETPQGTTYNAYLILDEKVTLIDTTKAPFTDEMLGRIREIIDPAKIDVLISNHVEPDHSGGLVRMAALCPDAEIITSPNGDRGLKAYYPELRSRTMKVVKTGDTYSTGRYTFQFVLMPMVHWPDSMSTYLVEEKILFSNDAFGQHISGLERFDDEIGPDRLLERAGDYYANIVLPFGLQVGKLVGDTSTLPIETICPSHGVILRTYVKEISAKYVQWAANETDPKKAVIVYDTMWGSTRLMAEKLSADLAAEGVRAELIALTHTHPSEAMRKLLEAKYIYVGSSTLNRGVMHTVAAFLSYMKGLNPKNRVGLPFGSYGWSGESVGIIEQTMKDLGWEVRPAMKTLWKPEFNA